MDINDFITQLEIVLECEDEGYIQCLEKAKMIKEKMWELKKEKDMLESNYEELVKYHQDDDDNYDVPTYLPMMYEGVQYMYDEDKGFVLDPQDWSVIGRFKNGVMDWEDDYGEKQHQRNKLVV